MTKFKYWALLLSSLFACTGVVSATEENQLQIMDPWVREAPPNVSMLGGFLRFKNDSEHTLIIVGSSSPLFKMVEIHRTIIQDGTARMVRQERVEVLPGAEAEFAPGGLHLMMMMPSRALKQGDEVPVNIELENGRVIEFTAMVKSGRTQ